MLGDNDALKRVLRGLTVRAHAEGFGADLCGDALDFAHAVRVQEATIGDEYIIDRK